MLSASEARRSASTLDRSETGADKSVALRRAQQKERGRLLAEIQADQKTIITLNEEV